MVIAAAVTVSLAACGSDAGNNDSTVKDTVVQQSQLPDTTTVKQPFAATGILGAITPGKDGYMAVLKGQDSVEYVTVFSVMKLEKNYKRLNTGDKVEVAGDTFHIGNTVHIQVKQFSQK